MIGIKLDMVNGGNPTLIQQATALLRSSKAVYWRDPSDLSTLFQDSAGTTPVTAVEQPVGLMLDKRTAGQLGSELVTNGTGDSATGWVGASGGSVSASGGNLVLTATGGASFPNIQQTISVTAGKTYVVTVTGTTGTSGNSPGVNLAVGFTPVVNTAITSGQVNRYVLTATGSTATISLLAATGSATAGTTLFDNISVREIPGVHFIQATPASRPTLSSRYNLLTKTEQFDDAAWTNVIAGTGVNPVRVANDAIAPDGTLTADKITFNAPVSGDISFLSQNTTSLITGTSYTATVSVKAATGGDVGKTILYRTVAAAGYSQLVLTDSYQRITLTANAAATSSDGLTLGLRPALGGSSGTVSVHVWGASLVPAADASLPYQRVNTATDYDFDFAKFPPYLRYDGVDDSQASAATVDLTGTDKITVVGAWHKASDAAAAMLIESSADASANNGAFNLMGPVSAGASQFRWLSRGTVLQTALDSSSSAPVTRVVSGIGDIAGDRATLRINGVQVAQSTGDQGTGNFGNLTVNVGSRAGSSLRFNGREYGFALFNTTLTASELAAVEAYFRSKSRAY